MIGMTDLIVTTTSRMLIEDCVKAYRPNSVMTSIQKNDCSFTISFPTDIHNEEKEGVFETLIEKILHLRDPSDRIMETKIEARYLQQASKEYLFCKGELVRYRGFIDTDNPVPMVTKLLINLSR